MMASFTTNESCILCKEKFTVTPTVVKKKGSETLIRLSKERSMFNLATELQEMEDGGHQILVHFDCRRKFTDTRKKVESESEVPKKLRSSMDNKFNWKEHCFLCSQLADFKHAEKGCIVRVMTLPLRGNLMFCARERDDEWGKTVLGRLESCNDLVAEEAVHHLACMTKFRLKRSSDKQRGKPVDKSLHESFISVCEWLEREGDCELHTIGEIQDRMRGECEGQYAAYCPKYIKKKLKERYKDHVYFAEIAGLPDVVCFKEMANYVIKEKKRKQEETKEDIITAAAKIVKAEMRELSKSNSIYPTTQDISNLDQGMEWIPDSLKLLLSYLIPAKLKQVTIGQCIVQAAKPRSLLCPVPFGLGVELDKSFGSKWLLNHLAKLGFSVSSDEVLRYKQSAIEHSKQHNNEIVDERNTSSFTQWSADNVDHNIITLTGKGTFHGMGIISMTSCAEENRRIHIINRLNKRQPTTSFVEEYGIPVLNYLGSSMKGHLKLKLKPIMQLKSPYILPPEWSYDFLWHTTRFIKSSSNALPNWSGFMQNATSASEVKDKAFIKFLPIIDLSPTDENCIYSTLIFIIDQAKKLDILVPCVTFDQPLWFKAIGIIAETGINIVARLGGFHTVMSFLGSIGKMMKGSGIEELFNEVYAENSVEHIISGKAVSRALRAHFLVESALKCLLFDIAKENFDIDVDSLKIILDSTEDETDIAKLNSFAESKVIHDINNALEAVTSQLAAKSRTAKLWLSYLQYISILKQYILAERTSNWQLHLNSTVEMLNLFASTGHTHYAKSARVYVQQMQALEYKHPWLHNKFIEGEHAVKRSRHSWAGLWSDLVIEQTLMRSVKSRGGLTRGRGMTESVRHMWVLSLNYSAAIHDAMTELSGVKTKTSEQHVDLGASRCKRDNEDWLKFTTWLEERSPFTYNDEHLHSLSTGIVSVIGKDSVNCERAEELGWMIQNELDNISLADATVKRKNQIKPLDTFQNTVKINEVQVYVNATVLFTRLAAVAKREDDEEQYFDYELTTEPMALFKNGLMRKPDKPALRRALLKEEDVISIDKIKDECLFVVDGGALLHRVCWIKGMSFSEIGKLYVHYIRKHYRRATVVFDGYKELSTKSCEHKRRAGNGGRCPDIEIVESNKVQFPQERFLSNESNKDQIIKLISKFLRDDSQTVINCTGDADTAIVSTALGYCTSGSPVVVVADDTDIVIMLLYHWRKEMGDLTFFQERLNRGWNMKSVAPRLDVEREHLLFVHAMSGCDTTSAPFGKGKASFLSLVKKSEELKEISDTMSDVWADQAEIGKATVRAFTLMYGGKNNDTLKKLRYKKYLDMACKGSFDPAKMPPTERSVYYHGLRVHLQIVIWKVLDDDLQLNPEEWGWHCKGDQLLPIMTDMDVAPENLLKVVRCNCKTASKNQCRTNLCSCRKHGLKCVATCGECFGESCGNIEDKSQIDEEEIDERDDERNIFEDFFGY